MAGGVHSSKLSKRDFQVTYINFLHHPGHRDVPQTWAVSGTSNSVSNSAGKASCLPLKTSRGGDVHSQMLTNCSLWVWLQLPVAPKNTWWASFTPEQHRGAINKKSVLFQTDEVSISQGYFSCSSIILTTDFATIFFSMVLSQVLCQNPTKDVPSAKLKRCAPAEQRVSSYPKPKEIKIVRRTQNQQVSYKRDTNAFTKKPTLPYGKC